MKESFSKDIYNFISVGTNRDINVLEVSYRKKHPDISKKPMCKNYYALHLILEGRGKLETPNGDFTLKKGDIFVRFPNETIAYYDYDATPFNYIFITFQGQIIKNYFKKLGISPKNRIVSTTPALTNLFKSIVTECRDNSAISDMLSSGYMQLIFSEIAKEHTPPTAPKFNIKENYVNSAIEFINNNISDPSLDANYVSQFINLNTDYFLRIFKEVNGIPFSRYLITKRLNISATLLSEGNTSISKVSESLGFGSATYFSRVFRKHFNQTPHEFMTHYNREKIQ